jgi:3-oxoacyl-[acyl-carrier protein] reductase
MARRVFRAGPVPIPGCAPPGLAGARPAATLSGTLIRLAVPLMKARGEGRIVNVTNIGAKAPGAGTTPTTVTRAAGLAMTRALSRAYAPHGILVNAVCIGLVRAGQHEARAARQGATLEALYDEMAKTVPLGRIGEADEAASVMLFLVSAASSCVTGSSINIDGGASAVC